ncbi:WS/DGAT/MGAT family O-acyltransferase [Saccharospirillum salsuginis]|uniref:diacylglycerol O-acyltransferase n=1 Tax=Saccharospirillum salsuginis TaxID=418750 RepID=A0A918K730_9GAMM|nr:wax ester/triacylglycerol synthase family O-acyltransferase [Saccharospirillum salsuginis]GGX52594.1 hypothetical protein GCM10007392_19960 [Saccharospirillum salsuginis]
MRERMSNVDTAWLRMDRPTNLMMITGLIMLHDPLPFETLRNRVEDRFLAFKRFRQRPVLSGNTAYWENDSHFAIERHVHRVALPGEHGRAELMDLASDLMSTPLDSTKPMWQFHLVERYNGGSAVIVRIHHCYADGIALMRVLLSLTDTHPMTASPTVLPHRTEDHEDLFYSLVAPVSGLFNSTAKLGAGVLRGGLALMRNPVKSSMEYARTGARYAAEGTKLATMPADSPTRFKGKPGVNKRLAWMEPIPLKEVRAIGKTLNCSVNDVLLSSVSGALREYLVEQGDSVDRVNVRALVPVNLRPQGDFGLGNKFGLVFLELPIGIQHPLERVFEVKRRMAQLRDSVEPVFAYGLLGTVGVGPTILQETVLGMLAAKASAVMTNVPGPPYPLYMGESEVDEVMFWVPQSGEIAMGVSILSYNDKVLFGVATDAKLVPDPEDIVNRFAQQFEQLVLATLMSAD